MVSDFQVGDIIANKFGHVLAIEKVHEDDTVTAFYECYPDKQHKYKVSEIRLLSRGGGSVAMTREDSTQFIERLNKAVEWAKNVHGVPKSYKDRFNLDDPHQPKRKKSTAAKSAKLSDEDILKMLKSMSREELEKMLREEK